MSFLSLFSSSLLLIVSFPPFDLGPTAWIALIPWLFELERSTGRRAFLFGYGVGFLFFIGTVGWIAHVTVVGAAVLIAYLALYFGAWGWFARKILLSNGSPVLSLLALPAGWVVLEFIRSALFSGFGWNLLAHTQWNHIPLIQMAGVTGVWGVSFLVVLVNTVLYRMLSQPRRAAIPALGVALLVAGVVVYGRQVVHRLDACAPMPGLKLALLQGNVPQPQKWDPEFQEAIWKRYEQLVAQAAVDRPQLVVWPETAVPGFLEERPIWDRLLTIIRSAAVPMLVGVATDRGWLYNSAVLFSAEGVPLQQHDKIHLVPFGEFVPLKPLLGWLGNVVPIGDFSAGGEWTVFSVPDAVPGARHLVPGTDVRFSVLVCFEDLFPALSRRFVREGAGWLLVITNDGWFKRSAASLQHLQCSVFRAVEARVWVARAANTGWTGLVDPAGRRWPNAQVPRFKAAVAQVELPVSAGGRTPYVRWGDWFPLFCLGLSAWAIMVSSNLRWKRSIN